MFSASMDTLFGHRLGWLVALALIVTGLFVAVRHEHRIAEMRAERMSALELWMYECQHEKLTDECAMAWDRSPTLRTLYAQRIIPDE